MGGRHDILRDEDAVRLLSTLLRVRPRHLDEVRQLRGVPRDRLDDLLAALAEAGFLRICGDEIELSIPEDAVASRADALDAAASLVARVGRHRQREHQVGDTTDLGIEVVRGRHAQWQAWDRYALLAPPRAPLTVYPSAVLVRDAAPAGGGSGSGGPSGVRAILPRSAWDHERDRATLEALIAARVEVRVADEVDSWIYVDPGVLAAVPLSWGEALPSSMVFVSEPSLLAALTSYAEALWTAARPLEQVAAPWAPVLERMSAGDADAEIARALRLSVRAVQRHIAEAMAAYDVASRFELGVAWGSRRVTAPASRPPGRG